MKDEQDYRFNNQNGMYNIENPYYEQVERISKAKTTSYIMGIATGLAASAILLLFVLSVIKFNDNAKIIKESDAQAVESVTDDKIVDKLEKLEDKIEKYFWKDVDTTELEDGLYKGIMNSLDDPYSVYYNHEELLELQEQTQGIYYGIGAYISQDTSSRFWREYPMPGGVCRFQDPDMSP